MPEEIPAARTRLGNLSSLVDFRLGQLTALLDHDASFDIVTGEFLLAAAAAYSPFQEPELINELVRVLKPGGLIMFTGWQVETGQAQTAAGKAFRSLFQLREAVHLLLGRTCFREFPSAWVRNRLVERGFGQLLLTTIPDVHHNLDWFVDQIRANINDLANDGLTHSLQELLTDRTRQLYQQVSFVSGFEFGSIYAITARKSGGHIITQPTES